MPKILCKHCGRKVKLDNIEASVMNCPLCGGLIAFAQKHTEDEDLPIRPLKDEPPPATDAQPPSGAEPAAEDPLGILSAPAPAKPRVPRKRILHTGQSNLIIKVIGAACAVIVLVIIITGSYYSSHPYVEIRDRNNNIRYQGHYAPEEADQLRAKVKEEDNWGDPIDNSPGAPQEECAPACTPD